MQPYAEKRDFPRMPIDCPARFRIAGADTVSGAMVKNLSGTGLLLLYEQEIEAGTQLTVEIVPGKTITPPLSAEASVLRCDPAEEGNYHIACSIERILSEGETGPEFP